MPERRGRRKETENPRDSGSQRYILNSVTRIWHIPAARRSSNGIFRTAMRTGKMDRKQIRFDTFLSIKRRVEFDTRVFVNGRAVKRRVYGPSDFSNELSRVMIVFYDWGL